MSATRSDVVPNTRRSLSTQASSSPALPIFTVPAVFHSQLRKRRGDVSSCLPICQVLTALARQYSSMSSSESDFGSLTTPVVSLENAGDCINCIVSRVASMATLRSKGSFRYRGSETGGSLGSLDRSVTSPRDWPLSKRYRPA